MCQEEVTRPVDALGNGAGARPRRLSEHLRGDVHGNGAEADGEGDDVDDDADDRHHRHRVADEIRMGDRSAGDVARIRGIYDDGG